MGEITAIIEQGRRAAPSYLARYGPLMAALLVLWLAVAGLVYTSMPLVGAAGAAAWGIKELVRIVLETYGPELMNEALKMALKGIDVKTPGIL